MKRFRSWVAFFVSAVVALSLSLFSIRAGADQQTQIDNLRDALSIIENTLWATHRSDLSNAETRQNGLDTTAYSPSQWDTWFAADDALFSEQAVLEEDLSAHQLLQRVKEDDGDGEIDIVRDLLDIAEEMVSNGDDASVQIAWAAERTSDFIDDCETAQARIALGLIELNSLIALIVPAAPPVAQTGTGTSVADARALLP